MCSTSEGLWLQADDETADSLEPGGAHEADAPQAGWVQLAEYVFEGIIRQVCPVIG